MELKYTSNYNLNKPDGTDLVKIDDLNENMDVLDAEVAKKVDKVSGKGLSTNDFTTAEKNKLAGMATGANNYVHPSSHPASIITQNASNRFVTDAEKAAWNAKGNSNLTLGTTSSTAYRGDRGKIAYDHSQSAHAPIDAQRNTVTSVAGKTGAVSVTKSDVGLGSVSNYGIATLAEARAGTSNVKYMTPSRVKAAIDELAGGGSGAEISTGTYTGNGASELRPRFIGFSPSYFFIMGIGSVSNDEVSFSFINGATHFTKHVISPAVLVFSSTIKQYSFKFAGDGYIAVGNDPNNSVPLNTAQWQYSWLAIG